MSINKIRIAFICNSDLNFDACKIIYAKITLQNHIIFHNFMDNSHTIIF